MILDRKGRRSSTEFAKNILKNCSNLPRPLSTLITHCSSNNYNHSAYPTSLTHSYENDLMRCDYRNSPSQKSVRTFIKENLKNRLKEEETFKPLNTKQQDLSDAFSKLILTRQNVTNIETPKQVQPEVNFNIRRRSEVFENKLKDDTEINKQDKSEKSQVVPDIDSDQYLPVNSAKKCLFPSEKSFSEFQQLAASVPRRNFLRSFKSGSVSLGNLLKADNYDPESDEIYEMDNGFSEFRRSDSLSVSNCNLDFAGYLLSKRFDTNSNESVFTQSKYSQNSSILSLDEYDDSYEHSTMPISRPCNNSLITKNLSNIDLLLDNNLIEDATLEMHAIDSINSDPDRTLNNSMVNQRLDDTSNDIDCLLEVDGCEQMDIDYIG